jgi:hypothetical protein
MFLRTLLAAGALLGFAASAQAADLYKGGGLKDGSDAPAPFLPSGFYVSVGVGGSLTDTNVSTHVAAADFNFAGVAADGRVGFDQKLATSSNWVAGVFAGVGIDDVKGQITSVNAGNQDLNWEAGVRLGYAANGTSLIYGLVEYTGAHLAITNTGKSTDLTGVGVGGGLEIDLASLTGKKGVFLGSETVWKWYSDWTPGVGMPKIAEDELTSKVRLGVRF